MRYKAFHLIGVEIYEKGEWIRTSYFKTFKEATEFARDMASALYGYKYITADEYGNKIDEV